MQEPTQVKEALQAQAMHKRSEGALLLQGKQGALLKGALLGGTWSIATCCCEGVGKHCCIQKCCYEQSEAVQIMTLQEE